jgi:hypothetical protein
MRRSASIRRILQGEVRLGRGDQRRVTVTLIFDAGQPAEIRLVCSQPEPGERVLARHLLDDGLTRPTGDGDVRVRPLLFGAAPVIRIRIAEGRDDRLVELPAEDVAEFLYWTHRLVPRAAQRRVLQAESPISELMREAR